MLTLFRAQKFRRGPLPFRYVMLITLVFFLLSTAAGLWIINKGIQPTLMRFAESQTRKIAPMVISRAVKEQMPEVKDINEIMITKPNGSGGTTTQFHTGMINRLLAETASIVRKNLMEVEQGNLLALEEETEVEFDQVQTSEGDGIVYAVPLGQATNNALLGNLGPRIPVRFTPIGDVRSTVHTDVEPYGINNVFIVVSIHIEVNVQIIIPFATDIASVQQDVPVAMGYFPRGSPTIL